MHLLRVYKRSELLVVNGNKLEPFSEFKNRNNLWNLLNYLSIVNLILYYHDTLTIDITITFKNNK